MGATFGPVDIPRFADGLRQLWDKFNSIDPATVAAMAADGGAAVARGNGTAEEREVTSLLLDLVSVAESNNLRLQREFGLLIKQQLYFDRYTRILAPTLDPLRDSRIGLQKKAAKESGVLVEDADSMADNDSLEATLQDLKDINAAMQEAVAAATETGVPLSLTPPEGWEGEWPPPEWKGPRPPKGFKMTPENVAMLRRMGVKIPETAAEAEAVAVAVETSDGGEGDETPVVEVGA
ncbi:hypothetical protein JKP88DRAFT_239866 [Tribonema minus]|uniref:Uncharacterized protein n=1 Tax=Tribonema minus TaxID=303371 RepID=A0A835YS14_9STRA|nr:hypothetical protein JKP88DRAFT_239866 [Tribonema minus]